MPEKDWRRALDRESLVIAGREPSDTPPNRNHLALAPKGIASTTPHSQGFRFIYCHSRRRLGSPWVGRINAALKRLQLAIVTPGATSTLSASSASLFLCRCLDTFFCFFTYATTNLQPSSCTVLYQTPGSSDVVVQSPVMPNSRRSPATQSVHSISFPPGPHF